ncbi:MAG: radical SAM protein [Paracoccaceae bacterium]|nr:radical SAM protein [Paracoccaceae bacterium]
MTVSDRPKRFRTPEDYALKRPVHAVWEITLSCNLRCVHCGSAAGEPRKSELSTDECLQVVESLAQLGTREITLIGGESYLRRDWTDIVAAIKRRGMYCAIQTGGYGLTGKLLDRAVDAGLDGVGVSIDGLEDVHDAFRGVPGSFRAAARAVQESRARNLRVSVNTTVTQASLHKIEPLAKQLVDMGVTHWQVGLMVPMGRGTRSEELLLQPSDLLTLFDSLVNVFEFCAQNGLVMHCGNSLGYFGPFEHLWRGAGDDQVHWRGCSAGETVIALESDGTVKSCPSLNADDHGFGSSRDAPVDVLWKNSRVAEAAGTADEDTSFCRTCYYSSVCDGGCTWVTDSLGQKSKDNPYCHYRVLALASEGLSEEISLVDGGVEGPFSMGEFSVKRVPIEPSKAVIAERHSAKLKAFPQAGAQAGIDAGDSLVTCKNCYCYVYPTENTCPHCENGLDAAQKEHDTLLLRIDELMNEVREALDT